jgi:hypothetical protein
MGGQGSWCHQPIGVAANSPLILTAALDNNSLSAFLRRVGQQVCAGAGPEASHRACIGTVTSPVTTIAGIGVS